MITEGSANVQIARSLSVPNCQALDYHRYRNRERAKVGGISLRVTSLAKFAWGIWTASQSDVAAELMLQVSCYYLT